jgi:hypothetical protein
MFCESSQESAYFEMFKKILSYQEDTSGKLTFAFADDTGLMTFVRSLPILDFASNTPATATSSDSE